ncbi:MAG TPA: OmpA family protein [Croceibacterium sp.]
MRKIAICLAVGSTVLASPAFARDGAWYVGGDIGLMIPDDTTFDIGATEDALALDHDYGFDGALFVGYDLGAFRLEAEVSYKAADLENYSSTIALPSTTAPHPPGDYDAGGSASALSFMLNGMLDFGDDDGISGFVGGGIGYAKVRVSDLHPEVNEGIFLDDDDSAFAWQVLAGVRAALSEDVDLTAKYRFFNVNGLSFEGFAGDQFEGRFRSHSILGGITFNFGAPEPPPPPPPPPPSPPPVPRPVAAVAPPPPPAPQCNRGPFIVYFDWDRDDITPQAATILDNAATAYASCGQAQVIMAGHADKTGSAEYNMGLAGRRANNVRSYMAGRGIPEGRITTRSFGEEQPRVPTADGVNEVQNRRVEVTYGPGSGG